MMCIFQQCGTKKSRTTKVISLYLMNGQNITYHLTFNILVIRKYMRRGDYKMSNTGFDFYSTRTITSIYLHRAEAFC